MSFALRCWVWGCYRFAPVLPHAEGPSRHKEPPPKYAGQLANSSFPGPFNDLADSGFGFWGKSWKRRLHRRFERFFQHVHLPDKSHGRLQRSLFALGLNAFRKAMVKMTGPEIVGYMTELFKPKIQRKALIGLVL